MRSRISASVRSPISNGLRKSAVTALGQPALASSIKATPDMIWPEVQNPHWKPSCSMNASWSGCSLASCTSPRRNAASVLHRGQRHTGEDSPAFDMDGACPAFTAIAPFLCARQRQLLAQCVEQGHARLHRKPLGLPVNDDVDGDGFRRWRVARRFPTSLFVGLAHLIMLRAT
jgi:hypothetical protein